MPCMHSNEYVRRFWTLWNSRYVDRGAVEEEGLHDARVRRAVADPTGAHLLHIELVPALGCAMIVEGPVEAFADVTVADEQ